MVQQISETLDAWTATPSRRRLQHHGYGGGGGSISMCAPSRSAHHKSGASPSPQKPA
jgi:hypothetical protein